jgi:sugar lactone lactonase YvrE
MNDDAIADVYVAVRGSNVLGECPLWDDSAAALYWVDGRGPALYRCEPGGQPRRWDLPEIVGSFAFRVRGGLLLALQTGLFTFDLDSGALSLFARPETGCPGNRFNDGRCDRQGRFWTGTMSTVSREPRGSLYRVQGDGACARLIDGVIVPNSIAWSPDGRTMYFADTYRHCIWTFDFDTDAGEISNRRIFTETRGPGRPDGSAVDAEGCLWNCEYAGGRVVRYTPDGAVDRVVTVPADNPTCCAFGDRDLRTLYVTSARQRLSPDELARQPEAGSVFAIRTGVSGLAETRFAG